MPPIITGPCVRATDWLMRKLVLIMNWIAGLKTCPLKISSLNPPEPKP